MVGVNPDAITIIVTYNKQLNYLKNILND